jgi:transglutaminase-like putative cysteine protease
MRSEIQARRASARASVSDPGSPRMTTAQLQSSGVQIKVGYELIYSFPQPTPIILTLSVHYSRASDMVRPDHMLTFPSIPIRAYRDGFGNWCNRLVAPEGSLRIWADALVNDSGFPDPKLEFAEQHAVDALPDDVLVFLLGSRYCETDRFYDIAWSLFGKSLPGWGRVQAICDFVHNHIQFGYEFASPTKTAWEVYSDRRGVCRDYAHLAVTLCRCMNIPVRYCTGYVTDIGLPPPYAPMDFAGWFEAYLGGSWHVFDPRNNTPRIGRILIARGRDAADVALNTTFGANTLQNFRVWAHDASISPG